MLFNSHEFLFQFLPCVLAVYFVLRHVSLVATLVFLSVASLYFYSVFSVWNLPILLASIAINWIFYQLVVSRPLEHKRTLLVALSIVINLALLSYYKYSGFVLNDIFGVSPKVFKAPELPLAISFFTFQQICFIVDKSRAPDNKVSFLDYAAYITFFPHLLAGPIVRHNELIPQLRERRPSIDLFATGLFVFALGLGKKVLIADSLSPWVAAGFAKTAILSTLDAWVLALSYTFQLYFDFSGYTDMAIGLALMLGFTIPENFNSPYKAASIQDFWRRWHMTLSRWLRDYLYIPLGGNRLGEGRALANLIVTMGLGGLWHGAGWTFVIWGLAHGIALALHRVFARLGLTLGVVAGWVLTFLFVVNAWVMFRAANVADAGRVYLAMYGFAGKPVERPPLPPDALPADFLTAPIGLYPAYAMLVLAGLLLICVLLPNTTDLRRRVEITSWQSYALMVWGGIVLTLAIKRTFEASAPTEFLYFQF